jgi:hypothetical protein
VSQPPRAVNLDAMYNPAAGGFGGRGNNNMFRFEGGILPAGGFGGGGGWPGGGQIQMLLSNLLGGR